MQTNANCTPSSILDFPMLLVGTPPKIGNVVVCFIVTLYLFLTVAILCDEYFVPSVEKLCFEFDMTYDVAGATFMAIATSSPEFFVIVVATFIMESDIGVGTIVGSSVFNSLAIPGVCGFFSSGKGIAMDWWPTSRDILWYLIAITVCTVCLRDSCIIWYEALTLVLLYFVYLTMLIYDQKIQKRFRFSDKIVPDCFQNIENNQTIRSNTHLDNDPLEQEGEEEYYQICKFPRGKSCIEKFMWIISWPFHFLCYLTVPNCRRKKYKNWYAATLLLSIAWLSVIIYLLSWAITVIGYNLKIPDSVLGITLLAIGTSIPEAVSSAIVARKGYGSMALSNSIASNTCNIFLCLGIPWCMKCIFVCPDYIVNINSEGLGFSTVSVLTTAGILYILLCMSHFTIGPIFGGICFFLYFSFLTLSTLIECNVFGVVNLPECQLTW